MKTKIDIIEAAKYTNILKLDNGNPAQCIESEKEAVVFLKQVIPLFKGSVFEQELMCINCNDGPVKVASDVITLMQDRKYKDGFFHIEKEKKKFEVCFSADLWDDYTIYKIYVDFIPFVQKWNKELGNLFISSFALLKAKYNLGFSELTYADNSLIIENLQEQLEYFNEDDDECDVAYYENIQASIDHYDLYYNDIYGKITSQSDIIKGNTLKPWETNEKTVIKEIESYNYKYPIEKYLWEKYFSKFLDLVKRFHNYDFNYMEEESLRQNNYNPEEEKDGESIHVSEIFGLQWFGNEAIVNSLCEYLGEIHSCYGTLKYHHVIKIFSPLDFKRIENYKRSGEYQFFKKFISLCMSLTDVRDTVYEYRNCENYKTINP